MTELEFIISKFGSSDIHSDDMHNFSRSELADLIKEYNKTKMQMNIKTAIQILERHNKWRRGDEKIMMVDPERLGKAIDTVLDKLKKYNDIHSVSFELPSDDIFDMPEVNLQNPLEEFYYYERPPYLEDDQKQFRERLQKALDYLKGN